MSSFMWFWGTSWAFKGNFSKAECHRKRGQGWDPCMTSASLRWVGVSGGLGQGRTGPPQELGVQRADRREAWSPLRGEGHQASRLALTGTLGLSFSWRASSWYRAGLAPRSCGRERKLLRVSHGSCKRDKWPSRMLFLSSVSENPAWENPRVSYSAVAQRGKVTYPGPHSKSEHHEESSS